MLRTIVLLSLTLALAAPAAAGNPDGPVGSIVFGFDFRELVSNRVLSKDPDLVIGKTDPSFHDLRFSALVPVIDYVTVSAQVNRIAQETTLRKYTDIYVRVGLRLHVPFTSEARDRLAGR